MNDECMKGPFAPDAPLRADGKPPKASDSPEEAAAEENRLRAAYAELEDGGGDDG